MTEIAENVVPPEVLTAGELCGQDSPIWYVGRRAIELGQRPSPSILEIVTEARKVAGYGPPRMIKPSA